VSNQTGIRHLDSLVRVDSQCFEHDIMVRNSWTFQVSDDAAAKIGVMTQAARMALYQDIDNTIKTKYVEALHELNKEIVVIHLKGYGPLRQAKEQVLNSKDSKELFLADIAANVLSDLGMRTVSNA
jgi:hypothetical protein